MTPIKVPYGFDVSVVIRREDDKAYVDVLAPIYVCTHWTMPHCYSSEFTDGQILRDLDFVRVMASHYPSN